MLVHDAGAKLVSRGHAAAARTIRRRSRRSRCCAYWAETGTSPWAGGFDAVRYGGSILQAIKAAGGDGWFPFYRDAEGAMTDEAHKLGLKVGAWTVNEAADMRALSNLDAICTDRPDVLKSILQI